MALHAVQRGVRPRVWHLHLPPYLRFDVDRIVALADDGSMEEKNLQLLCSYCNRVKGTRGDHCTMPVIPPYALRYNGNL